MSETNTTSKVEIPKVDKRDQIINDLLDRINRLEGTASKNKLKEYDNKNKKNEKIIYVKTLDNKILLESRTLSNIVEKDNELKEWIEDQELELTFLDKTIAKMQYIDFQRRYQLIKCVVVSETEMRDEEYIRQNGDRKFVLKVSDTTSKHFGTEFEIGLKFVN